MKKTFIHIIASFLLTMGLTGQTKPVDSTVRTITLDEVCICDGSEEKEQAFNFYKNSKLATTEDILSRMSGVNLIKRGAYGLEPALRNYTSGQTNITIDGMRIYGACTDKMDPVSIYVEPGNLSSIQVKHGVSGVMNGSTIGGNINMKLNEPLITCSTRLTGQLSQSYLSVNNAYYSSFSLQQSFHKLAYRVNGTYRKANDYSAGGGVKIPYSGFEKYNVGGSLLFKMTERQQVLLNYLGDWGKNIGYPALPMDVGKADAHIGSVSHRFYFNSARKSVNELKIYYNQITHFMDDTHRPNVPMHMDMPGWTNTMGAYDELNIGESFKVRLDYHQVYARADMVMYPKDEPIMYLQTLPENNLRDAGLSVSYKHNFAHDQQIYMNSRLDYYTQSATGGPGFKQWKVFNEDITREKNDVLNNGSLAYSKQFMKKLTAKLTAGYGERLPTSNERYGYYLFSRQDQYDYMGNLELKPEKAWQFEFSITHSLKKIEYSLNVFYNHINDYIYAYKLEGYGQMTIGAYGLKTYRNIANAVSKGLEFNAKAQLLNSLSYIHSIKYVYTETYEGKSLPLIPPLKLQHALRYNLSFIQMQMEHDYAVAQSRVNSDYGDRYTPSFHVFNFRVSKNIPVKRSVLQLSAACENIFDVSYREHLDIGQIPRSGRNFSINLNLVF